MKMVFDKDWDEKFEKKVQAEVEAFFKEVAAEEGDVFVHLPSEEDVRSMINLLICEMWERDHEKYSWEKFDGTSEIRTCPQVTSEEAKHIRGTCPMWIFRLPEAARVPEAFMWLVGYGAAAAKFSGDMDCAAWALVKKDTDVK